MFSLIWRFFPGPGWLRVIVMLAAAAALVWAAIEYIYPWVLQQFPEQEVTVGA